MIEKFVRFTGTLLLIALSAISIFFCQTHREIHVGEAGLIQRLPPQIESRFYDFRMRQTLDKKKIDKEDCACKDRR